MRANDVAPAADAVDVAEAAAALPSQGPLLDSLAALGVSSGGSEDSSMMPASLRELELPPLDDRMEREVFAPIKNRRVVQSLRDTRLIDDKTVGSPLTTKAIARKRAASCAKPAGLEPATSFFL